MDPFQPDFCNDSIDVQTLIRQQAQAGRPEKVDGGGCDAGRRVLVSAGGRAAGEQQCNQAGVGWRVGSMSGGSVCSKKVPSASPGAWDAGAISGCKALTFE